MQGVVKAYDPTTSIGVVVADSDMTEFDLAPDALEGSLFRMLRQGQRVVFDVDDRRQATRLRLGAESDMGTPGYPSTSTNEMQAPAGGRSVDVPPVDTAL